MILEVLADIGSRREFFGDVAYHILHLHEISRSLLLEYDGV